MPRTLLRFYLSYASGNPCVRDRTQNNRLFAECQSVDDARLTCEALNAFTKPRTD